MGKWCAPIFLLLLMACSPKGPIPTREVVEPSATISSATVTATPLPSLTPSLLPPTATTTATATATSVPPTITPSLPPTLTADEREKRVRELLKTNGGCKLPCWWGIMPGKTRWVETERFLRVLGVNIGNDSQSDGTVFHGTGGFDFHKGSMRNDFGFSERDGLIESVYARAEGYNDPVLFQETWSMYSPNQLIITYGRPTRVWLQTAKAYPEPSGNSGTMGYSLWLFYDHLGFYVRSLAMVKHETIYHICPSPVKEKNGMLNIEMFLQSSSNPIALEVASEREPTLEQKRYIRSIDEATGLSVEQFYQLFLQKDKPACFDTPSEIWP